MIFFYVIDKYLIRRIVKTNCSSKSQRVQTAQQEEFLLQNNILPNPKSPEKQPLRVRRH